MKSEFANLLAKKMDRKDFLKHVGVGIVALTGVSAMLKVMSPLGGSPSAPQALQSSQSTSYGYGSSVYGGNKVS